MRNQIAPSTAPSATCPEIEIVDSERLGRAVHYMLIKTKHRNGNKALRVEAHDLDVLADMIDTARRILAEKRVPTGLSQP